MHSITNSDKIIKTTKRFESRSMHGVLPVVWVEAYKDKVKDINGKEYIDFTSGICVANAGHSNDKISEAIQLQIGRSLYHSYTFYTLERAKFLEYIIKNTPKNIQKAFLLSSGTEATECAIKLMKMYGQKDKYNIKDRIISFYNSMHGRTLGAEFLKHDDMLMGTWAPDVIRFPFPYKNDKFHDYLNFLKSNGLNEKTVCGIMLETYQGWSARFYPKQYMKDLVKWCKKNKILICVDEIQGGMGRTGKLFNYMHYDIEPDLVCVGKGFSSSVPLSGVLGRKKLLDLPEEGSMSSTHSANPLCCAVGLANFKEILRLLPSVPTKGRLLHKELKKIFPFPNFEVNGKGLLAGIMTNSEEYATRVCYRAMKKGLLLIKTGRESIKIAPPLCISKENLLKGLDILRRSK